MECFVVAEFLLTSASRGPSAIAEPLVIMTDRNFPSDQPPLETPAPQSVGAKTAPGDAYAL